MKKYRNTACLAAATAIVGGAYAGVISGKPVYGAIAALPAACVGAIVGVPLDMQDALDDFGGDKE